MDYLPGEFVYYKKYLGKVRFDLGDKCVVTLYNYHGFKELDVQIDKKDLIHQISI